MSVNWSELARGPAQIKRNEEKNERGVCRIQKQCGNNQGFTTVGCGSLVKLQMSQSHQIKYAIITSNKVFQQAGNDVKKYRVDFKKSESKFKTFELHDAVSGPILEDPASGLAVIPLNSDSPVFCRRGPLKKKGNLLKHSPFKVEFLHRDQRNQNELCCHMVADDPSSNRKFGVKTYELAPDSSGQLTCTLSSFALSTHVRLGAAILRREDNEWSLVGILNPANQDPTNPEIFLPVWLPSELFQRLNSVEDTSVKSMGGQDGADDDSDDSENDSDDDDDNDDDNDDCSDRAHGGEDGGDGTDGVQDENDDEATSSTKNNNSDWINKSQEKSNSAASSAITVDSNSDQIKNSQGTSNSDFKNLLRQIHQAAGQSFENLKRECASIELSSLDLDERVDFLSVEEDGTSKRLLSASIATKYVPLKTTGDGNCLFRASSILAFGHENGHEEMRVRTVVELVVNSEFYLEDKEIMGRIEAQERALHPGSEKPFSQIDPDLVRTVFENDVLQTARRSSQASFWHLQALGAVLNRVVQSVYPERGAREVKKYFDATIWPRQYDQEKEPLAIMWTHTTGGDASNFIPNHFVPLIPVDKMTYFRTEGSKKSSVEHNEEIKQMKSVYSESRTDQGKLKNKLEQENDVDDIKKGVQAMELTNEKDHKLEARRNQLTYTRLSTKVTDIPFNIYSEICLKLNIRDEMSFKDFRLLGEKLGYSKDMTRNLGQRSLKANPTDELLRRWCESDPHKATVEKLIELLKKDDFGRIDVVEILEECPQLSIKVTDIPFAVYSKVCLKLNTRDEMFYKDFRLLGEKMSYPRDVTRNLEQSSSRTNPTDELLQMWCQSGRQATVGRLIELLKEGDLQRMDVVEILEDWTWK